MKRALITGVSGLVGTHLADILLNAGHTVIGVGRSEMPPSTLWEYRKGDLADADWITRTIASVRPDWIFHLAGCASVRMCQEDPRMAFESNVSIPMSLLDAIRRAAPSARVLLASSAEVYGSSPQPLHESSPTDPKSTYATTKLISEQIGALYWRLYGIAVLSLRFFYSIGGVNKGSAPPTLPSGYAYRIAAFERTGSVSPLRVGALSNTKDFIDVRDIAYGCIAAAERGQPGATYNLCSGKALSYQEIVSALSKLTSASIPVIDDESYIRPFEIPYVIGSHDKLTADTGWKPKYDILRDTLPNLLEYWREQLQATSYKLQA